MATTVVVGGGPAGLATAYRLGEQTGRSILLLERAPGLGGLAAGFSHGDYVLDFGPHRLHTAIDPTLLADLRSFPGLELETRRRRGLIRLRGRYLPYPVGPRSLLGLGAPTVGRLAVGALAACLRSSRGLADSYEAVLRARLGGPLYDLFYGPYAEKVWGRPGAEIAADQAERRVNQRGPADLVRAALGRGGASRYLYPRGGFGRIPAAYAAALTRHSCTRVACQAVVEQVHWRGDRIAGLTWEDAIGSRVAEVEHLAWSAPLPELVRRMAPPPPREVRAAADGLSYRAVVMCYLALNRPSVGSADTYYFPERRFPFNRVVEQKRFDPSMAPADRTVLAMDLACDPDDALYRASDQDLGELVIPALEEAGLASRQEVAELFSRRLRGAYPVFGLGYRARLAAVETWLDGFENLWLLGRQGLFMHNNTHHSLHMGYRAADAIRAGDRSAWTGAVAELSARRVED